MPGDKVLLRINRLPAVYNLLFKTPMTTPVPPESDAEKKAGILIVDDQPEIQRTLQLFLEQLGYATFTACDVLEALKLIVEKPIDMILLDFHMPKYSGLDFLTEIRRRGNETPVIMVTGESSLELAVECIKKGAADYIKKPFNFPKMANVIKKILSQRESLDPAVGSINKHFSLGSGYKVLEVLGEGATAVVYLVEKIVNNVRKKFALKWYKTQQLSAGEYRHLTPRFLQEARAISTVKHPNIVKLYEYGANESTQANFLVMEFIHGVPLQRYLTRSNQLDYIQKAKMIHQMSDALSHIHAAGICHRDIKPANIMVDRTLNIKLTDFGLAKISGTMITHDGGLMGSPNYMAPEAFISSDIPPQSDIFSLGVLAYELLLGRHPFYAENLMRLCYLIRNEDPHDPSKIDEDLPLELQIIVLRMLDKELRDRYHSAEEVTQDIQAFLDSYEG